jgi:hypothetical protein
MCSDMQYTQRKSHRSVTETRRYVMARPNGSTKLSSRGRDLCSAASIMHSLSISAQRGPRPCSGRDVASGALLRALHKLALPAHRARTLYLGILMDKDQMVKPPPRALVRSGCYCLADGGSGHG